MSQTKAQAKTASEAKMATDQATNDTNFIVQSDLLIANAIAHDKLNCTLTLTKGVSASNVSKYYQDLGYSALVGMQDNYGYDSISVNSPGVGYQNDDYNLDQPADLFGYFYDQYWLGNPSTKQICDGIKPLYIYLSWQ
jgi:hypothetical protein